MLCVLESPREVKYEESCGVCKYLRKLKNLVGECFMVWFFVMVCWQIGMWAPLVNALFVAQGVKIYSRAEAGLRIRGSQSMVILD
jgi:hypothetical protein